MKQIAHILRRIKAPDRSPMISFAFTHALRNKRAKLTRQLPFLLSLSFSLALSALSLPAFAEDAVELTVFAAASLTETIQEITAMYEAENPGVEIVVSFDSSGTLKTQILEGAEADLFISAAEKQMDELSGLADPEGRNNENDLLLAGSRIDLIENKVCLAVPDGNPKQVKSFDDLAQRLPSGEILLAMGGSDVPVGQYTQKILASFGLDEEELSQSGCITYGSNVKEVTTQVREASVDCGIIYQTDAASASLTVVDTAEEAMCGPVIYPAAVLKRSAHPEMAQAFLDYLKSPACSEVFEKAGFTALFSTEAATETEAETEDSIS